MPLIQGLDRLTSQFPRAGHVIWLGIRPGRKEPMQVKTALDVSSTGLDGDHR